MTLSAASNPIFNGVEIRFDSDKAMLCPMHAAAIGRDLAMKAGQPNIVTARKVCACDGVVIPLNSRFAWLRDYDPATMGGRRYPARTGGRGPSMVGGSSRPVEASPVDAPAVMAPPVPVAPPVPAAMDLDLLIAVARKAAESAVSGILGRIDVVEAVAKDAYNGALDAHDRIVEIEAKPATNGPIVTYVASYVPNADDGPAPATAIGPVHKDFPKLVQLARACLASGSQLWLWDGMGWGKTHHVFLLAQVLGIPYYCEGSIADRFIQLLGYNRPTDGVYQTTQFRQAFQGGGIINLDEVDRATDPGTPLAINMATSAARAAFPDGTIARHSNFLMIGSANTDGSGATSDYVGAIRYDAAFLDRCIKMQWGEDEALETALCPDAAPRIQALRARAKERGIRAQLSMRASQKVRGLLAGGFTLADACKIVVGGIMTADQYRSIV